MSDNFDQLESGNPEGGINEQVTDVNREITLELVSEDSFDTVIAGLDDKAATWVHAHRFRGKLGSSVAVPDQDGRIERVLFGWGTEASRVRERFHLGAFSRNAPLGTYRLDTPLDQLDAEEAALGWLLGQYQFDRYRPSITTARQVDAQLITPDGVDGARLAILAEGVFIARDLINTPANDMSPAALESAARKLAERHGAQVGVVEGEDLLRQNLPLIHVVGRAADEAPRLIDFTWGQAGDPKVTLVGKGVCFDTGGLNLKPSGSMGLMKKDMGGAANVLGLAHMIMSRQLPVRLRVLIPAVENAVSRSSFRPGDVLTSRKGLTVEVNNTDAEGRLVLADALALGCEDKPEMIVDMATLTGAARVALGPDLVPYYTDDAALARSLADASGDTADPIWRLPLWPAYDGDIEPMIADLDNAPAGGMAGSITAALFLKRFVDATPWVHFDIYGWTPKPRSGRPKGGEAQGIRAIFSMLEQRYATRESSRD